MCSAIAVGHSGILSSMSHSTAKRTQLTKSPIVDSLILTISALRPDAPVCVAARSKCPSVCYGSCVRRSIWRNAKSITHIPEEQRPECCCIALNYNRPGSGCCLGCSLFTIAAGFAYIYDSTYAERVVAITSASLPAHPVSALMRIVKRARGEASARARVCVSRNGRTRCKRMLNEMPLFTRYTHMKMR